MANEMRDRLLHLIYEAEEKFTDRPVLDIDKFVVDYLIENGVVVPPCKVGDTVYYPYEYRNVVLEKTVIKIVIEKEDRWLDVGVSFLPFENIGKTVFLTKAEAEQKLKEMRKEDEGK